MLVRGGDKFKPRFAAIVHCQQGLFAVFAAAIRFSPARAQLPDAQYASRLIRALSAVITS